VRAFTLGTIGVPLNPTHLLPLLLQPLSKWPSSPFFPSILVSSVYIGDNALFTHGGVRLLVYIWFAFHSLHLGVVSSFLAFRLITFAFLLSIICITSLNIKKKKKENKKNPPMMISRLGSFL